MDAPYRNGTTALILPGVMVLVAVVIAGVQMMRVGSPQPTGPLVADDLAFLRMIEEQVPADLKGLFDRTFPDKPALIRELRELRQWALALLENPPAEGLSARSGMYQWRELDAPAGLSSLGGFVVLNGKPDDPGRHVTLALGGGFHHYGVMIGAPGFKPNPSDTWEAIRWADGIWGVQER